MSLPGHAARYDTLYELLRRVPKLAPAFTDTSSVKATVCTTPGMLKLQNVPVTLADPLGGVVGVRRGHVIHTVVPLVGWLPATIPP